VPSGEIIEIASKIAAPVVTLFVGMAVWALTRHYRLTHLQAEYDKERRERESVEAKLEETRRLAEEARQAAAERYDRSRRDYHEAYAKFQRLRAAALRVRDERDELLKKLETAPAEDIVDPNRPSVAELEAQLATAQQELLETRERIEEATRTDGRIWLRPPAGPVPTFRACEERQCTIISVLNLKGGVGKTTIAANLAATMADKKSRCLLIDLDYQRSLSMLLVSTNDHKVLHRAGLTIQHFLAGESHGAKALLDRLKELDPELANCSILVNSDSRAGSRGDDGLEEIETRLMVEWLFDRGRPDPRFFLREALHERAVGDVFRYVFLDCPPRLTTACVNALAASDFVLIPVVPDAVSIRAAENLLNTLRSLRQVVCPNLRVLAVVPNMVKIHQGKPTKAHADALGSLRVPLRLWDQPILVAESCIRYDSEFGLAAAKLDANETLSLAVADDAIRTCFKGLAKELLQEMRHHENRRAAAVPA
jgi:cellulose biosynthesis protein BcsQ